MVRVCIPPGFTWDLGDGHPIEGPWDFCSDRIDLTLTVGEPKQEVTSGEYMLHSDGSFYKTMDWTREETAISTPLAYSVVVICLVNWFRRIFFCLALLSPFSIAGAATYAVNSGTGKSISYPSTLAGGALKIWRVEVGTGTISSNPTTINVTATSGGKPTAFSHGSHTYSQNYYLVVTDSVATFEAATKLKWIDPYLLGDGIEPQSNDYGNWAGSVATNESGDPVDSPFNPVVTGVGQHKADMNVNNPFGHPATPILKVTPTGGGVPVEYRQPTLQPGQTLSLSHEQPGAFNWEIGWDLGDGVKVWPGGSGATGTSAPVPGGGTPGSTTSTPSPVTTPALTSPAAAPAGDVKAAVDRHALISQQFGEAARTASGITNNNLESLNDLFEQAVEKLDSIDDKTGTEEGTGGGAVTIEGQALTELQGINSGINGSTTAPSTTTLTVPSSLDSAGSDNKLSEVADIRGDMAEMGTALQGAISALGLGANYGSAPIAGSFTVFGRTITLSLEDYAWVLDLIRNIFLGMISLQFVWRLLAIVRGALVA